MSLFSILTDNDITWNKLYHCTKDMISRNYGELDFNLITIPINSNQINYPVDWLPIKQVAKLLTEDKSNTLSLYRKYTLKNSSSCGDSAVYLRTLDPIIDTNGDLEKIIAILYYAYLYSISSSKSPVLSLSTQEALFSAILSPLKENDLIPYYFGKSKYTLPKTFIPFLTDLINPCELSIELFFKIVIRDIYELSLSHKIIKFKYTE